MIGHTCDSKLGYESRKSNRSLRARPACATQKPVTEDITKQNNDKQQQQRQQSQTNKKTKVIPKPKEKEDCLMLELSF